MGRIIVCEKDVKQAFVGKAGFECPGVIGSGRAG